jgi:hypothetical protein
VILLDTSGLLAAATCGGQSTGISEGRIVATDRR